ncbi:MAG TPA: hypothetical protein VIM38_05405 [Alphaproteobacteria bacterium]|jgi:uncharacterized membrane protein HdeD (DUF308 family)
MRWALAASYIGFAWLAYGICRALLSLTDWSQADKIALSLLGGLGAILAVLTLALYLPA